MHDIFVFYILSNENDAMQSDDTRCDRAMLDEKHDDQARLYSGMGCHERTSRDEKAEQATNATYRWVDALYEELRQSTPFL